MEIGNCWLKINIYGSTVYRRGVTPAEVVVLQEGFRQQANGVAISTVYVTGERDVPNTQELKRLRARYRNLRNSADKNAVESTYPGMAKLPTRFNEVEGLEVIQGEPEEFKPVDSPTLQISEEESLALDAVAAG